MDPKTKYGLPSIGYGLGSEEGFRGEMFPLFYELYHPPVVYKHRFAVDPVVETQSFGSQSEFEASQFLCMGFTYFAGFMYFFQGV